MTPTTSTKAGAVSPAPMTTEENASMDALSLPHEWVTTGYHSTPDGRVIPLIIERLVGPDLEADDPDEFAVIAHALLVAAGGE